MLRFVPSMEFLSGNYEYLKIHNLNGIPHEFFMRIGELESSTYEGDVMRQFHRSERMFSEAEGFIYVISDQILMSSMKYTQQAIEKGVEHRFLGPKDIKPPEGFYEEAFKRGLIGTQGKARHKFLERLDIMIIMTEKEAQFQTLTGSFDYTGFKTTDYEAIKWCHEIYSYYWESTDILVPDSLKE